MFVKKSAIVFPFIAAIAIGMLSGCSGRIDIDLAASGSAKLRTQTKVDGAVVRGLAERIASFTGNDAPPADAPFFSADALKEALKARKDLSLDSVEIPDHDSMKASFAIANIMKLGTKGDEPSPFFTMKAAPGQKTLSLRIDRDNVALLPELIPAFSSGLFEMLAPPALYGDEISEQEYRDNSLALFVGAKNLPAVDKAAAEIRITPSGKIVSQKGGRVEGNTFIASLPLLTILVLEKPYEFSLSWKE
jgi:hypothetical protein